MTELMYRGKDLKKSRNLGVNRRILMAYRVRMIAFYLEMQIISFSEALKKGILLTSYVTEIDAQ